jgi:hypothetical protein
MAGERMAREQAKQERLAKLKNEVRQSIFSCCSNLYRVLTFFLSFFPLMKQKSSMNALSHLSGFAESVTEINSVRKKITKVLDHQEEARKK